MATVTASATLAAAGTLSPAATGTTLPTATLAGTGSLTATAKATSLPVATLRGTGSLWAGPVITGPPKAALAGVASIIATAGTEPHGTTVRGTVPAVRYDAWSLYAALGPWTQGDAGRGYPLLLFCDALAAMVQPVDDLVRDQGTRPGWSQLLDVQRCPRSALPWLGQFVGVDVDPSLPDAQQRTQLTTQSAEARGTPAAIIAAAQRYVTSGATVRLTERDGDPYRLTVTVFSQNLLGMTYNDVQAAYPTIAAFEAAWPSYSSFPASGAELTAAVQAATPAGLVVTVDVGAHATYNDIQAIYPTQAAFQAAFSTYNQVQAWVPPS
jgi:hypothetical protein